MGDFVVRRVLVVDDDDANRAKYAALALNRASGVTGVRGLKTEVAVATSAAEARELLSAANARGIPFHVLVTDLFMRPEDGTRLIQTLPLLGFTSDTLDVVLISMKRDASLKRNEIEAAQVAWEATGGARFACVLRGDVPARDGSENEETAFCDAVWEGLFKKIAPPTRPVTGAPGRIDLARWRQFFVTQYPPLITWIEQIGLPTARTDVSIHLTGRPGVGKEQLARLLHYASSRRSGPFEPVNVSKESLFEASMFGWVKGAFTGATYDGVGSFEKAHGGTLFLDEIGHLSKSLQPKLLRVLQDHTFRRLGEACDKKGDFRVITATNRDLGEMVRAGEFEEALYHRLCMVRYEIPSLESRPDDIPSLLGVFWARHGNGRELSAEVVRTLQGRAWPWEVRELENYCKVLRAFVPEGDVVSMRHIQLADEATSRRQTSQGIEHLDMPLQRIFHCWFYPRLEDAVQRGDGIEYVIDTVAGAFGLFFANEAPVAQKRIYESWRHHKQCCPVCQELAAGLRGSRAGRSSSVDLAV